MLLLCPGVFPWSRTAKRHFKKVAKEETEKKEWTHEGIASCLQKKTQYSIGFCRCARIVLNRHNQKFVGMCLWWTGTWHSATNNQVWHSTRPANTIEKKQSACPLSYLFNSVVYCLNSSMVEAGSSAVFKAYNSDVWGVPRFQTSHWERKQVLEVCSQWCVLQGQKTYIWPILPKANICVNSLFPEQTVECIRGFLTHWNPVPIHYALALCVLRCQVLLEPPQSDLQPTLAMEWLTQLNYPLPFPKCCLPPLCSSFSFQEFGCNECFDH